MIPESHPILSCARAAQLEASLFAGDEEREWTAMQRAGRAVADAILSDYGEIGGIPASGRLLVLVGKGHNGGDALLAAAALLAAHSGMRLSLVLVFGVRELRPLAARAYRSLVQAAADRLQQIAPEELAGSFDICLDGIFGFQFHPPASPAVAGLLARVNQLSIRFRAAVDLPSAGLFQADFSYATGSVKDPLLTGGNSGRIRYLNLGFFSGNEEGRSRVLTASLLEPLGGVRAAICDKRSLGHLLVVGGSRGYPGAVMMTVLAALRSGVGLVTAFVPASLVPTFAARVPEAMWVGWPETPDGSLALEGRSLLYARLERASALVIGPGLGRERETQALAEDIVGTLRIPLLLDADALQAQLVRVAKAPLVLTPHAGEYSRIAGQAALVAFARKREAVVVLKGPFSRISDGRTVYHSFFGGPVLARGGSGDLLAGLIGGLLAQSPREPLLAACRGTVWHGVAADRWARAWGQRAVQTTQLLDFLPAALRESGHEQ